MTNSADTDQLASDLDLHCLQRFSRTRVNGMANSALVYEILGHLP